MGNLDYECHSIVIGLIVITSLDFNKVIVNYQYILYLYIYIFGLAYKVHYLLPITRF